MKKNLLLAIILELLLIFGMLFSSYLSVQEYKDTSNWVQRTQQVLLSLNALESNLQDMQSGIRGFHITQKYDFLIPYHTGEEKRHRNLQQLNTLISDNEHQINNSTELSTLIESKTKFMHLQLQELISGDFEASRQLLATGSSDATMKDLQDKFDEMRNVELELLRIRTLQSSQAATQINYTAIWAGFAGLFILSIVNYLLWVNISKQTQLENSISEKRDELELSNKSLEQFAYSASHDLQEPLRMVSAYCGLIKKRYAHCLDLDGHEFIDYAIDGASRMKKLIESLLEFSRVGRIDNPIILPTKKVVDIVIHNLETSITESKARIRVEPLPDVEVNQTALYQLFQNILSNAIKFRTKNKPPEIQIKARQLNDFVEFSVIDNGVGVDEKYKDKLFTIFQRLHTKEEFAGTGIGLAICKKIVDNYKGVIKCSSNSGGGATFSFTLPIKK